MFSTKTESSRFSTFRKMEYISIATYPNQRGGSSKSASSDFARANFPLSLAGYAHPGVSNRWNRWSENQSINRYQSIKLVNWYRLVSVNRRSIDNHTKIVHRLTSIGRGPRNRRHAHYLSDHPPFLGSPGDEIGETIPTQSFQCKEYTSLRLHVYSNYPLARHCLPVS